MLDTTGNIYITPDFFSLNYEKGDFDGAFVHLGLCRSGQYESLQKAFKDLGAYAVLGYSHDVTTGYDISMAINFMNKFVRGDSPGEAFNWAYGNRDDINQKIILVNGMNKLSLDFDFVSEEAGRFKDTDYADSFKVTIFRYIDKKAPSIEEFKASLADFESYEKVLPMKRCLRWKR